MFQTIFPNYQWNVYQFNRLPSGFKPNLVENTNSQKEFVKFLEKKFNIKSVDDWYTITNEKIQSIISMKSFDVMKIVKEFYPQLNLSYFNQKPIARNWKNRQNQLEFMNQLAENLNIKSMEDWYKVTIKVENSNFYRKF